MTDQEKALLLLGASAKGNFVILTQSEASVLKYIASGSCKDNSYSIILDSNWQRFQSC